LLMVCVFARCIFKTVKIRAYVILSSEFLPC